MKYFLTGEADMRVMACNTLVPPLPIDVSSISREEDPEKSDTSADGRCMVTGAHIVTQASRAERGACSVPCELESVNKQQCNLSTH